MFGMFTSKHTPVSRWHICHYAMIKKCCSTLFMLAALLLTACGNPATTHEVYPPDFEIQISQNNEQTQTSPDDLLSVHFINIGEGDAILLIQGEYAMLVDGGPVDTATVVVAYLQNQGIAHLEYLVATHPFADHVGGLPVVLRNIPVAHILLPMVYHDTPIYNNFLFAVEESSANVAVPFAGHTFELGDATITVLSPNPTDQWENRANYSIVMRVEFGSTSFLLTGDAMREAESNLLNGQANLSSDVLKVARHGAASATTSAFLDAVNPSIAVISAGVENSFLSQEVLKRLEDANAHIFRTDLNGNIIITSDGTTLGVSVESQ